MTDWSLGLTFIQMSGEKINNVSDVRDIKNHSEKSNQNIQRWLVTNWLAFPEVKRIVASFVCKNPPIFRIKDNMLKATEATNQHHPGLSSTWSSKTIFQFLSTPRLYPASLFFKIF